MKVKDFIKMIKPFGDKELGLIVWDSEEQKNIHYYKLGINIPNIDESLLYIIEPLNENGDGD